MTFQLITDHVELQDRYFISVERVNGATQANKKNGCYFVLSQNSKLLSECISADGTFSAVLDEFSISGSALIVQVPGIKRANVISFVNPTSPGDLSYIDGCSNSVLIGPPRNGDACLNYLYFPEGIDQAFHTHPSIRIGIVLDGSGTADYYEDGTLKHAPLKTGDSFILHRHVNHRFSTAKETMSVMVFHPDSEDGPQDEFNPMKSRTYITK